MLTPKRSIWALLLVTLLVIGTVWQVEAARELAPLFASQQSEAAAVNAQPTPTPITIEPVGTSVPLPLPAENQPASRAAAATESKPKVPQDLYGPTDTESDVVSQPDSYMSVTYTFEDTSESAGTIPSDMKRIVVAASLGNEEGEPILISPESLAMIGTDGNSYRANPADPAAVSSLVGSTVNPGESIYNVASFDIPAQVDPAVLEWCLNAPHPCYDPVQSEIP